MPQSKDDKLYKLSPSDFAYLWNDCKHCYYQKVKLGVFHSGIFPSMFGRINKLLQDSIMGMNLSDIHPDLPSGIIEIQEGYMKSITIDGNDIEMVKETVSSAVQNARTGLGPVFIECKTYRFSGHSKNDLFL